MSTPNTLRARWLACITFIRYLSVHSDTTTLPLGRSFPGIKWEAVSCANRHAVGRCMRHGAHDGRAPRRILQLRFGLVDGRARTLEEVGREFGVTRERIRQIEAKALRKLRHPTRSRRLKDFLE